jgi:hypothetical protein
MFFIGFPLPENQFCVNFSTALYFLMIEEPRGKPGVGERCRGSK